MTRPTRLLTALFVFVGVTLSACGGGSSNSNSSAPAALGVATAPTGTPSGTSSGLAISGVVSGDPTVTVTVTTTHSGANTTRSDSSGNFNFSSLTAGTYTVTPTQAGHTFSPISRVESISTSSVTDVVFAASTVAVPTYTLSGTVSGSVMAGVTITLNGANLGSALTDLSGNYTFAGLVSGTYTVNASLAGYAFTAPRIVSLGTADSTGVDFTSSAQSTTAITFDAVATLPQATLGKPYSASLVHIVAGGTAPYRYKAGLLDDGAPPLGMIVNPNGNLTGTASVAGLYDFTVCAVDATGQTSSCEPTSLTVLPAPISLPPPGPAAPATVTLSASPAANHAGSSSVLKWSSTNATSCNASGGWSGTQPTNGSVSVAPTSSTTYILACAGPGGAGKASVVITVTSAEPTVPTVALKASAASILSGSTATLNWSSKNASVCTGSGGWSGNQGTSGSMKVSPKSTTTYGLECLSSTGSAIASTKITVNQPSAPPPTPAPTVSLTASSSSITAGGSSTLHWTSSNADSCTASNGWNGPQTDSGSTSVTPAVTTTYSLSCSGAGGTTDASAKVTVNAAGAPPPTASGTSWVYYNGTFDWPGDFNFAAAGDYSDSSGGPLSGGHDIKMTSSPYGGWLPYAQNWDFNSAPYSKLTFSLKPTRSGQTWQVYFVKVGDIPVGISLDVSRYGPTPVAGQWATYTVPLQDLGVLGKPIYKFAIQDQSGAGGNVWYIDNVGFVP